MSESPAPVPDLASLRNYSVIYFGNDWFAENRTSSHHIARRLAQVVPVLYVETPGIRRPQATARDVRKLWRKLARAFAPPQKLGEAFYLATMPQIPFRNLPMVGPLNQWLGAWLVRRAVRKLGFRQVISWFVVPHPGPLAKRLRETLTVYYCIDDYASFPGVDPAVQTLDDELTKRADIVFVAPRALVESKRRLNPNVRFSPHGVDFDLFAQASDPSTEPVEQVRGLKHPVIGYFGHLGQWFDCDLLLYLAQSRPLWTFLLIGHISTDVTRLRECPNVILPGPTPYETLPRWAAAFDVAIYPHQVNRQTKHSNPLKFREYLATGKPVVSVTTPESAALSGFIYLADNPGDYLAAIERALAEDSSELRRQRQQSVANTSWDVRFAETVSVVDELL